MELRYVIREKFMPFHLEGISQKRFGTIETEKILQYRTQENKHWQDVITVGKEEE